MAVCGSWDARDGKRIGSRELPRAWLVRVGGELRRPAPHAHRRKDPPPQAGDDANSPAYIFTEPRVGYRMPNGRSGVRRHD